MDGKSLINELYLMLREDVTTSSFMNLKLSYDHLYTAALEFARRTNCLTSSQTITTVADQSEYDINADFLKLYLANDKNEFVLKYNDGTNDNFVEYREYSAIINSNNSTSVSLPYNFSIIDKQSLISRITGTTTAAGTLSNEECTLTDSGAPFADVNVGDTVHNATDSSQGVVIEKTSSSALVVSLFNGTLNYWGSGDSYIVIPQGRKQLVLDPASLTAGHTLTFYYASKPAPVYSSYRTYRFDSQYASALIMYAAYLYKYQDKDVNFGNIYLKNWENQVRMAASQENKSFNRTSLKFNLKKRSFGDRSYR